ncbi:MAG: hypothetical protein BWX95_01942 [Bacteroidetes bacterium ADurb.Bin141]|nr:MAG: hypothetical protein BWX95_01942 [Bacteroidetes bacterium ADurb.Bin141]
MVVLPGHKFGSAAITVSEGAGFTVAVTATRVLEQPKPVNGMVIPGLVLSIDKLMIEKSLKSLLSELPCLDTLSVPGTVVISTPLPLH